MTMRILQDALIRESSDKAVSETLVCVRHQLVGYARCSRFVAGCNVAVVDEVRTKLTLPIYHGVTPPRVTLKMRVRFAGTVRNRREQVYEDIC